MVVLELIGWRPDLLAVSLIVAISDYSPSHSLVEAKKLVDDLLAGNVISLHFDSDKAREEFRLIAESLGAILAR